MKRVGVAILSVLVGTGLSCKPQATVGSVQSLENFSRAEGEEYLSLSSCSPSSGEKVNAAMLSAWESRGTLKISEESLKESVANLLARVTPAVELMADAGYEIHITDKAAESCAGLSGIMGRDLTLSDSSGKAHIACYRSLYSLAGSDRVLSESELKQINPDASLEERLAIYVSSDETTLREQLLRSIGYVVFGRIIDFSDQDGPRTLKAPEAELWSLIVQLAGEVMAVKVGVKGAFAQYHDLRPENFENWSSANFAEQYNDWIRSEKTQTIAGQFVRFLAAEAYQNYSQCDQSRGALESKFSTKVLGLMTRLESELAQAVGSAESGTFELFGGRLIANRIRARQANRADGIYGLRNWVAPQVVARNNGVSYAHRGLDWQWRDGSQMGAYGQGFGGYYTNNYYGNTGHSGYTGYSTVDAINGYYGLK